MENQAYGAIGAEYALQGKLEKAKRRYGQARREALRRIEIYEEAAALFEPLRDALEIVDVAGIRLRSQEEARQRLDEVIAALSRLPHKKVQDILDVIKTADWVIDLGPEGGHKGGKMLAQGTPEKVARMKRSHTGRFLKRYI